YTLQLLLNTSAEAEDQAGGSSNNTLATAQNLDPGFVAVAGSAQVAAVRGSAAADGTTGQVTVFSADFESGNAGFTVNNGTNGLWHNSVGRGAQAGHSPTHSFYYGQGEGPNGGGNYTTGTVANSGTLTSPSIA